MSNKIKIMESDEEIKREDSKSNKEQGVVAADCWAHMVDVRHTDDEVLINRFRSFTPDAREMLYDDWKDLKDDRMKHIVELLKQEMH